MARFHVIDTFTLENRKLSILAGRIVDGTICPGQRVRLLLEGKGYCWVPIEAIEFARRRDREDVCLCIDYAALDTLGLRRDLALADVTVAVESRPPADA